MPGGLFREARLAMMRTWAVALLAVCGAAGARGADDVLIADFEGADYGAWKVEGEAFGPGPARGTLANQQKVGGYLGQGLVNSYYKGDGSKGKLTSPAFRVERRYLNMLVGGGNRTDEACVNLFVDGQVVLTETGADDEKLDWVTWDLSAYAGKWAMVQVLDRAVGSWGHVNVDQIVLSDTAKGEVRTRVEVVTDVLYGETYRPQFHFTAQKGWLNDPNGLVHYKGEWHLFFQHNPVGNVWGNMTWGHAVSTDLLRWKQLPHAIERDELGDIWSGTAVVDAENTAGFGAGALVLFYTAAGGQSAKSKGKPFTQCIAYSTDGRTFTKFEGNPVLKNVAGDNRDPKVFWHGPTKKWVMALWVPVKAGKETKNTIQFFGSSNLKEWTYLSRIEGLYECPDILELAVDGDGAKKKWVLFGADGQYFVGSFDGTTFTPDGKLQPSDWGANFYAAQVFSNVPDGRQILIGWMRNGKYPRMPFNQQMGIPVELSLRTTPAGVRLCKWPVKEVETLVARERDLGKVTGKAALVEGAVDGLDLEVAFEAKEGAGVAFELGGAKVAWKGGKLTVGSSVAELKGVAGPKVRLRMLVDRTSVEVFQDGGVVTVSNCFLPKGERRAEVVVDEGVEVSALKVRELKSVWK
jgi:sucrose-6-phosphate hydrolase SacC (GH32 family)